MVHSSAYPDNPHYITRNGWLRAAVFGANDGIVSVSALLVGVAAAEPDSTLSARPMKNCDRSGATGSPISFRIRWPRCTHCTQLAIS